MQQPNHLPTDAAARKNLPIGTGVLDYFPLAMAAIANVSRVGNEQHNPGQPLHWDRSKSTDHFDCAIRHLLQRGTLDSDGVSHTAKAAWRINAMLQEEEENRLANEEPPEFEIVPMKLNIPDFARAALAACNEHRMDRLCRIPRSVLEDAGVLPPNRTTPEARIRNIVSVAETLASRASVRVSDGTCCYIAGPMRGLPHYNFPAFNSAAAHARDRGYTVFSPAAIETDLGLDPINHPEDAETRVANFTDQDWLGVIIRDLACILQLDPRQDAVMVLPGWEASTGALAEVFVARWRDLPILDATTFAPLNVADVEWDAIRESLARYLMSR